MSRGAERSDGTGGGQSTEQVGGTPGAGDATGLGDSLRTLRHLGRDLASVPSAIREAPDRAAMRPRRGIAMGTPGRGPRRAMRAAAWPVFVIVVSVAAAVAVGLIR
ncbi:hypothetical protein [Miltoncostaea oceani]|uniref:hypothetical protein n=1 Tax=Miltoncostaea oceani TaxID=2843216 RepID=UPI001C3E85FA|nr:hypothetical protein [Miltoncostaea oceani]